MDQIHNLSLKCPKHIRKDIEFIQVRDVLGQSEEKSIFYCSQCISHDNQFNQQKYILIDQLLEEGDNNIMQKWPPIDNSDILQILKDITHNSDNQNNYYQQILDFFISFRAQILQKVDGAEKKALRQAQSSDKNYIIQQYQQISNILVFKNLLKDLIQQNNFEECEKQCKLFISKAEAQKKENKRKLEDLSYQALDFMSSFKIDEAKKQKQKIINQLEQIKLFDDEEEEEEEENNKQIQNQKLSIEQIMSLIGNKTNFCSESFLNEFKQNLQKIRPLIEINYSSQIFKQDYTPINFYQMNEQRFQFMKDYAEHAILLEQIYDDYVRQVKNSSEIEEIQEIINQSNIQLNQQENLGYQSYFIETYPFLRTLCQPNQQFFQNYFQEEQNEQDILQQMEIVSTQFNDGINNLNSKRNKNGEIILQLNKNSEYINCISDFIIERNKKYVFRIQINAINGNCFYIGLMKKSNSNLSYGHQDSLSCYLVKSTQIEGSIRSNGINTYIRGQKFELSNEKTIELRVSQEDQILEVLDYPNYQYKMSLKEADKQYFVEQSDLVLYLSFWKQVVQMTINYAKIVDNF